MLMMLVVGLVVVYEAAVAWVGVWLNRTRYAQGPPVLHLTHEHGLHLMDLAVIGAAMLPWLFLIPSLALGYLAGRGRTEAQRDSRP